MGILSRLREQAEFGNELARQRRSQSLDEFREALYKDPEYLRFIRENSDTLDGQRRIEEERQRRMRRAGFR